MFSSIGINLWEHENIPSIYPLLEEAILLLCG
jgi:hypothetical protein